MSRVQYNEPLPLELEKAAADAQSSEIEDRRAAQPLCWTQRQSFCTNRQLEPITSIYLVVLLMIE
jgi:hypothetical protein